MMIAYKGFDAEMQCRGFQFEVGKTYEHKGDVKMCSSGFHACEAPLDIWNFYPPINGNHAAEVDLGGVSDEKEKDTKRVGKSLTIKAKLDIAGLVKAQIAWTSKNATVGSTAQGDGVCAA